MTSPAPAPRPIAFPKARAIAAPAAPTAAPAPEAPPATELPAANPAFDVTRAPWSLAADRPAVSDELARALATLAAESAIPVTATNAPFLTAAQRDQLARETQQQVRRQRLKSVALAALVAFVALLLGSQLLFREPALDDLETHALAIGAKVLPLYSTADQPLRLDSAVAELRDRIDGRHLRYYARITLRLTKPLYEPALTNGTLAYRQYQAALIGARTTDANLKLFTAQTDPQPPDMPELLQMDHRGGDPLVILVPFTAQRTIRVWRLNPPELEKRTAKPILHGKAMDRFPDADYLVFGGGSSGVEVRKRMVAARTYIVAVAREAQKRGLSNSGPTTEHAAAKPASSNAAPRSLPAFDPDAVAVPETAGAEKRPAIDPDAPAVEADRPAVDPDAPAIDPDAVAVPAPASRDN